MTGLLIYPHLSLSLRLYHQTITLLKFLAPSISTSVSPPLFPPSYLFSTPKLNLNFVTILGAIELIWMQSQDVRYSLLVCPSVHTLPYARLPGITSHFRIFISQNSAHYLLYIFRACFPFFFFFLLSTELRYPVRNFLEN